MNRTRHGTYGNFFSISIPYLLLLPALIPISAIIVFIPIMLFFIWAMRYNEHPEEYGMGSKEFWLGNETTHQEAT